jgi:chlorite dismutase
MKRIINLTLSLIFSTVLISFASGSIEAAEKIDKDKILELEGVIGTFGLFKVESAWEKLDSGEKKPVLEKVKMLIESYSDRVVVDTYSTLGLTKDSDFFIRLHAYHPEHNQKFIKEFLSPNILGRYFSLRDLRIGITKGLNYVHKTPGLLAELKAIKFEGPPPVFGIMVTVDKTSDWWNLSENQRLEMIKEHTVSTLHFIKGIKRKLYHSTGLGETDFVTYFETSGLKAFNDLIIALRSIEEAKYTTYGTPVIGHITPVENILK